MSEIVRVTFAKRTNYLNALWGSLGRHTLRIKRQRTKYWAAARCSECTSGSAAAAAKVT